MLSIKIKLDRKLSQLSGQGATKLIFQSERHLLSSLRLLKLTHEVILHAAQQRYTSIAILFSSGLTSLKIPLILSNIALLRLR